jgi:hypothetical protein
MWSWSGVTNKQNTDISFSSFYISKPVVSCRQLKMYSQILFNTQQRRDTISVSVREVSFEEKYTVVEA